MPVDSITTLAQPTPSVTQDASAQSNVGRDDFMKLLVTQLQNQDPLDPMDNREMITQLSQLTGVEQLVSIEQRMAALEVATAGFANTQVAGLVGKQVTANLDGLRLDDTGSVEGAFSLQGRATETTVTIRDAEGNTVRVLELGEHFAGHHAFTWDGLADNGERQGPGRYQIEVSARDENGQPVVASTEITGRATGVSYDGGFAELLVGNTRVMLGDVISISE